MKLFELLQALQDTCRNDGNLEREVRIKSISSEETISIKDIKTTHPNFIDLCIE